MVNEKEQPLAYRARPRTISDFVGQEHILTEGKPLRVAIEQKALPASIILWGPPGCGKTTLAKLIARATGKEFLQFSAVSAGKSEIRAVVQKAQLFHQRVVLFLDEIHRFNKSQQDFLLPYVENGTLTLIGATTENPSFEVISALLSRSRVFVLHRLRKEDIEKIIKNALKNDTQLSLEKIAIDEKEIGMIADIANGDARAALNILELAAFLSRENSFVVSEKIVFEAASRKSVYYDKNGEEHYNIISALHKSMRDSDAQAAIYWTMRMIEGGEDPKYIVRRMIQFASEDIGNADPRALQVAVAAKDAVEFLGYPDCDVALVQAAAYLANAKKSNAVYRAMLSAREDIGRTGNLQVPLHLRNAPTKLMKELEYGKGYQYAHEFTDAKVDQKHLPNELDGKIYYEEREWEKENSEKENNSEKK